MANQFVDRCIPLIEYLAECENAEERRYTVQTLKEMFIAEFGKCTKCGAVGNTGKFCSNCGAPMEGEKFPELKEEVVETDYFLGKPNSVGNIVIVNRYDTLDKAREAYGRYKVQGRSLEVYERRVVHLTN